MPFNFLTVNQFALQRPFETFRERRFKPLCIDFPGFKFVFLRSDDLRGGGRKWLAQYNFLGISYQVFWAIASCQGRKAIHAFETRIYAESLLSV